VHENGNKPIIIISIEAKEGGKLKSKLRWRQCWKKVVISRLK
jgi:hypothetical protein